MASSTLGLCAVRAASALARAPRTRSAVFPSASAAASAAAASQHRRTFASRPFASQPFAPAVRPCPACRRRVPARRAVHLAAVANATVDAAEAAIAQLHAVSHTPWFLTIPLVALGVNLLFRVPFSLHARGLAQKRSRLAPLLQAWTAVHSKEVIKEQRQAVRDHRRRAAAGADAAPAVDTSVAAVQSQVAKRYLGTSRRIYRTFGVQQWKLYGNLLALPPWLVVIEAIRRMCGAPVGLLGMLFRGGGGNGGSIIGGGGGGGGSSSSVDTAAAASVDSIAALTEPSLAAGGCLWFPDLTLADPYHVLPFALSAVLVANVLPGTDAGRRALFGLAPQSSPGSGQAIVVESMAARALQRTLVVLSVSVGFVTMHFPAAIHLYWLASAASSFAITRSIRFFKPIRNLNVQPSRHRDFPWIQPAPPAAPPAAPVSGAAGSTAKT